MPSLHVSVCNGEPILKMMGSFLLFIRFANGIRLLAIKYEVSNNIESKEH